MPYNEKFRNYSLKYAKEKLKRVPLDLTKERYEEVKAAAERQGSSVNGYIKDAITEKMSREDSGSACLAKIGRAFKQKEEGTMKEHEFTEDEEDELFCEQLLEQAEKEDDGKTIPLEEAAKRLGISL